jgi:DNA-binding transcriptional LysR family regulator
MSIVMDLYQLRYFLAVVETRNFSRAAERVFVSQPTLSAGIKKLETDLGTPLFNREKRNISLTEAGNRFLPRARTVIYECNAAKMEAGGKKAALRLQLGIHPIMPIRQITRLLTDYRKSHPDVQIAIKEGSPEQIESWLDEGRIDAALSIPPALSDKFEFTRLFTTKCLLALSQSHPLASRTIITLPQLNRQDFIHRSHCVTEIEVTRTFARANIIPQIILRTNEDDKAIAMVTAGIGLCMMPDIIQAPGLIHTPVEGVNITRTFGLSWMPENDNDLVQDFRLFARSHIWKPRSVAAQNLEWAR